MMRPATAIPAPWCKRRRKARFACNCLHCREDFIGWKPGQKFCTPRCYEADQNAKKIRLTKPATRA
jgi:hypothetical protein